VLDLAEVLEIGFYVLGRVKLNILEEAPFTASPLHAHVLDIPTPSSTVSAVLFPSHHHSQQVTAVIEHHDDHDTITGVLTG
jgi:hypothetical protein